MTKEPIFCTSFCNHGHSLKTGRPIDHECYKLPLSMLRAERAGDVEGALKMLVKKGKGRLVRGRRRKG